MGHPVAHARTSQAMNALFERNGLDAVMVPFDVPGGGSGALSGGAVNVMRRVGEDAFAGDMPDGEGFVAGLAAAGHSVAGRRICIVGAAGAASAIAVALVEWQPAKLTLINRSRERLMALHERLRLRFPDLEIVIGEHVGGHDLVVNATSLGLREA
ncbi:hypothetical protein [Gluconacetobacter tumulicola]|nr:hypothetical protein [Gluconacetobacter tumulicola]